MSADVVKAASLPLQTPSDKSRDFCHKVKKKHKRKRQTEYCEDKYKHSRLSDSYEDSSLLNGLCYSVVDSSSDKGHKIGQKSRKRKLKR